MTDIAIEIAYPLRDAHFVPQEVSPRIERRHKRCWWWSGGEAIPWAEGRIENCLRHALNRSLLSSNNSSSGKSLTQGLPTIDHWPQLNNSLIECIECMPGVVRGRCRKSRPLAPANHDGQLGGLQRVRTPLTHRMEHEACTARPQTYSKTFISISVGIQHDCFPLETSIDVVDVVVDVVVVVVVPSLFFPHTSYSNTYTNGLLTVRLGSARLPSYRAKLNWVITSDRYHAKLLRG